MQNTTRPPRLKKVVLAPVLIFLVAYLLFLALWIPAKNYYGRGIVFTASKIVAGVKDMRFEGMTEEKDIIESTFSPLGRAPEMAIEIPVTTSTYTFNAPLTFAIMATLYPFIRRRGRAYGEALVILVSVHFLYVFSFEAKQLTDILTDRGLEAATMPRILFYQFLWGFTDNMIIRFEPFLIGFYMFARFRQ